MTINFRFDVYVHFDMPGVEDIVALTQELKARNDRLAQAVSELTPSQGGDNSRDQQQHIQEHCK